MIVKQIAKSRPLYSAASEMSAALSPTDGRRTGRIVGGGGIADRNLYYFWEGRGGLGIYIC